MFVLRTIYVFSIIVPRRICAICVILVSFTSILTTDINRKVKWIHSHNHGLVEHTNSEQSLYIENKDVNFDGFLF